MLIANQILKLSTFKLKKTPIGFVVQMVFKIAEKITVYTAHAYNAIETYIECYVSVIAPNGTTGKTELAQKVLNLGANTKIITLDDIIEKTAKYFGIKKDEILSSGRSKDIANARRLAMYLSREITQMSLPEIGAIFGKNHTTVLYSWEKVKKEAAVDKKLNETIDELNKFIAD